MSWQDLTNDELRNAIRGIVNRSTSKEQVMQRAKDELGYPYNIAVRYSDPNPAGICYRTIQWVGRKRQGWKRHSPI